MYIQVFGGDKSSGLRAKCFFFSSSLLSFVCVCTCGGGGCRRRRIEWMKHPPRPVSAMASSCVFQTAALFSPHLSQLSPSFPVLLLLLPPSLLSSSLSRGLLLFTPLCLSWLLLLRLIFFLLTFGHPATLRKIPHLSSVQKAVDSPLLRVQDEKKKKNARAHTQRA